MKKYLFIILTCVGLISCAQNKKDSEVRSEETSNVDTKIKANEPFKEGVIELDIYFPGNDLSELLKKTDPSKGNIKQQMEKAISTVDAQQQQRIQSSVQNNPIMAMQVILAPLLQNRIFVKGDDVTAKCDGLTYHLENTLNAANNSGKIYVVSQSNPKNAVTFNYDDEFFGNSTLQTKIDSELYDRVETEETKTIAGYVCKKMIYTLKGNASPMSIVKLDVWTSKQMPQSLNFIHPYYLEEDYGIMKIDLYPKLESEPGLVYEFKKVTPTTVESADMSIKQSTPLYNAETDLQPIAAKLMGIMFGAEN